MKHRHPAAEAPGTIMNANQAHSLDGGIPSLSSFERHWHAASDAHC